MMLSALQGRALTRTIDELKALLSGGEVEGEALSALEPARDAGLWCEGTSGGRIVASHLLIQLIDALPNSSEALAAVFSFLPELRAAWNRIVLARLGEMGDRRDLAALCDAVTVLGLHASQLVDGTSPLLAATTFGELERLVLPSAAHEAQAFPVLLRTLGVTAGLAKQGPPPARALPDVSWDDPSQTWVPGRLLRLPSTQDNGSAIAVLTGALDDDGTEHDPIRWTLRRPWAFLLAQMVFTKEAWEAERISGSLALELEPAHIALFQSPPRVKIVVTLPTGEEVRCGSLGEFTLQVLGQLGVAVLGHRVTADKLDDRLGAVVEALLRREVWRFDHGTGGRRPGYSIHSAFSDACYRALGSRAFYRLGSGVTAAVRRTAETWARDRVARAGAPVGLGGAA